MGRVRPSPEGARALQQVIRLHCSAWSYCLSHATLASLNAKPVDDIVQALYNEHYIHLPVLDRNGAEHEEFEFFYAPYLATIHNIDFKTLTDQRRGTIFALDVPFTLEARYLRTRPTAIALKPPLGFIGENKVTLYVPKETHRLDRRDVDILLMAELLKRWERCFANDSPSIEDERLFRSLNMANAAAMLPAGADAKLYDIVRSVALWASAFEILYPAKKEAYKGIYAALNSISWNNSAFREFLGREHDNIQADISERNLCGRLMLHLDAAREGFELREYFTDTEYNRNLGV
jgi:hypothetical protein